jgi:methyl-accepting chemotaxis protein
VASGKNEATGGVVVVQQAVEAMGQIDEASKKIASIINLIDGIAFQTNLLALNAAVEAARAGDHGRGFAVVAGEVRSLAQKAAQSANEIKLLIEDSSNKVKEGSHLVDKTGKALNSIAQSIEEVNDIVTEIAAATNEQSSVINQVNKAVAELEEVNQLNTALVEESSHSSLSLNNQTDDLITKMNFFKG